MRLGVSTLFIRRPVATALFAIAIFLCGILAYTRLSVSPLPQVDFPTIQVTTQLPGANSETIVALVTAPLERQLGQIPALAHMSSQSSFGFSQITLQFELGRDIDAAGQDVQSAITSARGALPRDLLYPPTYAKINPADMPILTLALISETNSIRQLSDLADMILVPRLSEVSGVGRVSVQGNIKPAIRIQADLNRLAAYRIGLPVLRSTIDRANVSGPKGSVENATHSYTISSNDQMTKVEEYRNLVLGTRGNANILLRDLAEVTESTEDERTASLYQGFPAIILDIRRQPGANIIKTVEDILYKLPDLSRNFPSDTQLVVVHDRTETIRASIHEVEITLVLSTMLVVLVVLFFLGSWRAMLIAAASLPLSIIATFAVMWLCGFSLNNLSLMALTISTGFVVDDAIVMIENIMRKVEEGKKAFQAALEGAGEIGFTVISLTLSLIAVFIPLLFMSGLMGRMFREFALTLTITVLLSALISLTVTPMMCAIVLRQGRGPQSKIGLLFEKMILAFSRPFHRLWEAYVRSLDVALRHRVFMWGLTFTTLGITILMYVVMPKGFLPVQDTGLLTVTLETSPNMSFDRMNRLQQVASQMIRQDPDVAGIVSVAGVGYINATQNVVHLSVSLQRAPTLRSDTAAEVANRLKLSLSRLSGVNVYVQPVQEIQIATSASRSQYQYTLSSTSPEDVTVWSRRLTEYLKKQPELRNVTSENPEDGTRVHIEVDREKASLLNVPIQNISDMLHDSFGQRQVSTIYTQSNQYRIILEALPLYQQNPDQLDSLYVPNAKQIPVPLSSMAQIKYTSAPLSISHQHQFPATTISFDLAPGISLSEAVALFSKATDHLKMPHYVIGKFGADAAEFEESLARQPWLILAALVTIYIVLGMLYESFIHPITILSTLPSAGIGALLALWLTGLDLSIISVIGIVLLMGIVKKNAIMMIDFALEAERSEGLSPEEAIVRACHLRFRPIMMTTLAALLGALPLAWAGGAGAELRIPLGITIIGGLLLSQLLTLYTTPVIYLTFEKWRWRFFTPPHSPEASIESLPEREVSCL